MKKYINFILLIFFVFQSQILISQDKNIGNESFKNHFSYGVLSNFYYERYTVNSNLHNLSIILNGSLSLEAINVNYHGFKINPKLRIYGSNINNFNGFYFDFGIIFGLYNGRFDYGKKLKIDTIRTLTSIYWPSYNYEYKYSYEAEFSSRRDFYIFGGGISVGYTWFLGLKQRFVLDWKILGLNYVPMPQKLYTYENKELFYDETIKSNKKWQYKFYPASRLSMGLNFGLRF